jgi:AbiU2
MSAGPPPLTEEQYWRDYKAIEDDVHAAMVICYTHRALNHVPAGDATLSAKMNATPEFWMVTSSTLQSMLFIVLARILDHDPDVHSVHKLLNATIAHPEYFSKAARRARALRNASTPWEPEMLAEYDRNNIWEPTAADLRTLKKDLGPHKAKFDDIYRPLRNHVAHIILTTDSEVQELYRGALKSDIDQILSFLHGLVKAIWDMAYNGQPRNINKDNYGYAEKRNRVIKEVETMLRSL